MIGEMFRVTRWHKVFRSNGIVAVLHTLSLAVLYLDEQTGEFLERLRMASSKESIIEDVGEEVFNCLVEEGLLVPDSTNDRDVLIRLREGLVSDIRLNIMYLLLTDGCNLKCRYCFEDTPSVHDTANVLWNGSYGNHIEPARNWYDVCVSWARILIPALSFCLLSR